MLKRDGFNRSTQGLFNTAIASVSAFLVFQARTTASGSVFLRSKRWESLLAHLKVPIPEPQKRALIVTPGSDSGLFDEPLLDSVAAQVKEDSLVSSSLAVSKALSSCSGSKSMASSSSPLAGPSGHWPPRLAQRSVKRSASSSHSGGRKRFKGGKGSAPSKPLGFRKWEPSPCLTLSCGCLSLHWQAWRDGRGSVGGGGPPGGLLHTLPPASSSVCRTHPHAFVCSYFHQRGCSRGHPGVDCQGCCGACSSSLSRLLQPPVCGLEDLGGRGDWSSTCLSSIASWMFRTSAWRPSSLFFCLSDRGIGWPPSTFGRRIFRFLFIRNLVASCAFWLMAALTSSKRCASVCPRPHRSSLGLWLLCPLFFIPWVSVCVVTWTTGSSKPPPGRISSGISGLPCPSVASWGSWSTWKSPTSPRLRWYSISV